MQEQFSLIVGYVPGLVTVPMIPEQLLNLACKFPGFFGNSDGEIGYAVKAKRNASPCRVTRPPKILK